MFASVLENSLYVSQGEKANTEPLQGKSRTEVCATSLCLTSRLRACWEAALALVTHRLPSTQQAPMSLKHCSHHKSCSGPSGELFSTQVIRKSSLKESRVWAISLSTWATLTEYHSAHLVAYTQEGEEEQEGQRVGGGNRTDWRSR